MQYSICVYALNLSHYETPYSYIQWLITCHHHTDSYKWNSRSRNAFVYFLQEIVLQKIAFFMTYYRIKFEDHPLSYFIVAYTSDIRTAAMLVLLRTWNYEV